MGSLRGDSTHAAAQYRYILKHMDVRPRCRSSRRRRACCTSPTVRSCPSNTVATSQSTSPARRWSRSPAGASAHPQPRVVRRDRRVRDGRAPAGRDRPHVHDGAVHRHRRLDRAGCGPRRPGIGARVSTTTTASCASSSGASAAARSTRRATDSSRRSTARRAPSSAQRHRRGDAATSGSRSAPACTPANAKFGATTSAGWPCTSRRGSDGCGAPGEVVVSGTVKDLVIGSGIEFAERGEPRPQRRAGHMEAVRCATTPHVNDSWALRDSNPRPPPCKASEAERCAQRPLPRSALSETRTVRGSAVRRGDQPRVADERGGRRHPPAGRADRRGPPRVPRASRPGPRRGSSSARTARPTMLLSAIARRSSTPSLPSIA